MKRTIIGAFLMAAVTSTVFAQSGTNSPYSQYGLGVISDQSTGSGRGMNGVGLGFHESNQVNYLNPASYGYVDSLTFIFDVGMSGQLTNFKEGNTSKNAKNSDFEYVVGAFRAARNLGVSFGVLPYTNIGYNYSSSSYVGMSTYTSTATYSGSGGVHEAYVGVGYKPLKGLAIGANIAYLWGDYSKASSVTFSDSYANPVSRTYTADIRSYKLDLGAQYTYNIDKNNEVTLGVTYTPGHAIGGECKAIVGTTNTLLSTTTYDTLKTVNGKSVDLKIPSALGVGFMWNNKNRIRLGLDYNYQKWGSFNEPSIVQQGSETLYGLVGGKYMDRHKLALGGEFTPNELSRNFFNRVKYRAGVGYSSPYFKVNGADGPKEFSVSAGFGIPINDNMYKRVSYLNISGQWVHTNGSLIRENTFRINIGFIYNGRWFEKWKAE